MIDWPLYRDFYSTEAMRRIWSEQANVAGWLRMEQAIATCQAAMGMIPQAVARRLGELCVSDLDRTRLREDTLLVGRPIVGFVKQLRELVGPAHAQYVHMGSTTQDIIDTAIILQTKAALELLHDGIDRILTQLDRHADAHGQVTMMARTNGQHAVPVRFGLKLAVWQEELRRRKASLSDAAGRGLFVQFGGPVGDLATYDPTVGPELKRAVARQLGLAEVHPHWQNARDGLAEIVASVGLLNASILKIAHNVNLLSSSDIAELHEAPETGKGASSALAHKRNQRCSEFAEAVARLARQRAEQMNECTLHQHERSGGVWIAEWVVVHDVFLLTSGALMWMERLLATLEIDADRMRENVARFERGLADRPDLAAHAN